MTDQAIVGAGQQPPLQDMIEHLQISTHRARPRMAFPAVMVLKIKVASFKIGTSNPGARMILMHGVAPQCAVK